MAKGSRKFSWSAFLAGVLGMMALGVVAFGTWFWMVHVRDSTDAQFRDRTLNLWIMLTIFLALIAIGLYMLPKQHAKWMSPVQKGVVLALLAHILLILLTRITEVSQQVVEVIRPQQVSIHIQSAPEVEVTRKIREQVSEVHFTDPTLVHTAKAELPTPKLTRPKSTNTPVPKAQTTPQPLKMQAPKRQMAKSTEQAVKTETKLKTQTPELRKMQQAKPLKQNEARPTVQQKARMSRAVTEQSATSARLLEQKAQRAKANPSQLSPQARPWQVKAAAESHVKPMAKVTLQTVEVKGAGAATPVAKSAQAKAGPSNPKSATTHSKLANQVGKSSASGSTRTTQITAAAAHASPGGSSLAATPAGTTGSAIAAAVEQSVASRAVGTPGIGLIDVSSLTASTPSNQAVGGQPGNQPSDGQSAGLQIANTRLAGTLSSGSAGGGASNLGGGSLGAPSSASGQSVATVAVLGGGKFSHEIGGAAQPGTSVQPTLGAGPELVGPAGPAGGAGSVGGGDGTAAGPSEAIPGSGEAGAAGETYAGRQEASGPGGSFDGDVNVGGEGEGSSGVGELGSMLASASGTDPRGTGRGEVVGHGVGIGTSVGSPAGLPDLIGAAIGDLTGGKTGGKEGTPGAAIGGPGILASRSPSDSGGPGGGAAQAIGQSGSGELAGGLGGTASLASASGVFDRRMPPGIGTARIGNNDMPVVAVAVEFKPKKAEMPENLPQRKEEARDIIAPQLGESEGTKRAVADALNFLARCQEPDGRWTQFKGEPDPGKRKEGDRDTALTGLALLCFLAVDHTPDKESLYQDTVRKGIAWLLSKQKSDGDLRGDGNMYSHGIASLAVIETAAMTGNATYRDPAIRAANFILKAQNPKTGGWRYKPGEDGDTSILGWQVMALYSIQHIGVEIPDSAFKGATQWLDHVKNRSGEGTRHGYTDRFTAHPAMSAEAAFSRMLMGQKLTTAQQAELSEYLLKYEPGKGKNDLMKRDDYYLWYYTALALLQLQNDAWDTWNKQMQTRLLSTQKPEGALKGSWDPNTVHAWMGGRVYSTAMATLTLEVYYRYLPIFAQPQKTKE